MRAAPSSIWSSVDYALDWPRELLRDELVGLINDPYWAWTPGDVELLLREAFHTRIPAERFALVSSKDIGYVHLQLDPPAELPPAGQLWVNELLQHLEEIRRYAPPPPLWRNRQAMAGPRLGPEVDDVSEAVAGFLVELEGDGYFAHRFGEVCVDTRPDERGQLPHQGQSSYDRIRAELQERLAQPERPELWPPAWSCWDEETMFEVIEAVHDLVARPRRRWIHEHDECGRHYEDFDADAGRRIYRTLINRILAERGLDLRLAADGEDEGRLIRTVDDARSELVDRALTAAGADGGDRVKQAIARFRQRGASAEDKRMVVVALFGVLEERSAIVKAVLLPRVIRVTGVAPEGSWAGYPSSGPRRPRSPVAVACGRWCR